MRAKLFLGFIIILATVVMAQVIGCSLIGFGIGALIDSTSEHKADIPGWKLLTVKPGTPMEIVLSDGQRVVGTYAGTHKFTDEEYAEFYEQALTKQPEEETLPPLGDTITVIHEPEGLTEREFEGELRGFDFSAMMIRSRERASDTRLGLEGIRKIADSRGRVFDGEFVRKLVSDGKIPFRWGIAVVTSEEKTLVPLHEAKQIVVQGKGNAKWIGLAVGGVVDLVIVIALAASEPRNISSPSRHRSSSGEYSCPFVYSFNGEGYVLDSEIFGGAIFKAAQRTDFDNLEHLEEINGTYRLRIANKLDETQYVDAVNILVVDHPRGTSVVPDFTGALYVLSSPEPPMTAIDFHGTNVIDLVKAKDDELWVSNPFGRNPEHKSEVRDGLILEFERPDNARSVKLSLNVQNTLWASYWQGKLLELHGRELHNWYRLMNTSREARESLKKAMIREGMLLVQLWNGETWKAVDFMWEVGPAMPKDQVVVLDLRGIAGEVLRIRLESTVGLWIINSVQADYSPDLPVSVTEVSAAEAVTHDGKDIREILRAVDGRHYVMPTQEDWAELLFQTPAPRQGYGRSIILESTGYYTIHVPAEGDPQEELFARLMSEPGAFGQYTLRILNEHLRLALAELGED